MTMTVDIGMGIWAKVVARPEMKRAWPEDAADKPTKRSHDFCTRPSAAVALMVSRPSMVSTSRACFWLASRWLLSTTERSGRSEEHTSELQYIMRISYAVFCLKNKKNRVRTKLQSEAHYT